MDNDAITGFPGVAAWIDDNMVNIQHEADRREQHIDAFLVDMLEDILGVYQEVPADEL